MLIFEFESVKNPALAGDGASLAAQIARHLHPDGILIDVLPDPDRCHVLLRNQGLVMGVEWHGRMLDFWALERLEKGAAELEAKRNELCDASLTAVCFCLVAAGSFQELPDEIKWHVPDTRLFEWFWIQSHSEEALLLREVGAAGQRQGPSAFGGGESRLAVFPQDEDWNELTTTELVAMARLGIELRDRRLKTTSAL